MSLGDAKMGQWSVMFDLDTLSFFREITIVASFAVSNKHDKCNFPGVLIILLFGLTVEIVSAMAVVTPLFLLLSL